MLTRPSRTASQMVTTNGLSREEAAVTLTEPALRVLLALGLNSGKITVSRRLMILAMIQCPLWQAVAGNARVF
jgi:hypothetical protein